MQNNNVYNNADSFAMAFDEAWEDNSLDQESNLKAGERLAKVLEKLSDHPFFLNSPSQAKKVAAFRMRLLDLK